MKVEPPFPEPELLQIDAKHVKDCGTTKTSPKLKISSEGGVANAIVKIESDELKHEWLSWRQRILLERTGKEPRYVLDQVGCEFSPHVLLMPAWETLYILNTDGFLHNVRAFNERAEMLFNDAMPKKGQVLEKYLEEPGRIIVRCGIHHWMHALVVVQEHPYYALTDGNGYFKISGIPDGNYTASVWHEELGEIKTSVGPETGPLVLTFKVAEA